MPELLHDMLPQAHGAGSKSRQRKIRKRGRKEKFLKEEEEEEELGVLEEIWTNFTRDCGNIYKSLHCLGSLSRQAFCSLLLLSLIFLGTQYFSSHHSITFNYKPRAIDIGPVKEDIDTGVELVEKAPACFFPSFDPLDASIVPNLKYVEPVVCSRVTPLTFVEHVWNKSGCVAQDDFELGIHEPLISLYVGLGEKIMCCYSNITRVSVPPNETFTLDADDRYHVGPCTQFEPPVQLKPSEEFILVKCFVSEGNSTDAKPFYSNTHSVVRKKPTVRQPSEMEDNTKKLNVIVLCFDTMSRTNLKRTLTKTHEFLRSMNFFEFHGFSKVGAHTFPNAFAMLAGLTVPQGRESCWRQRDGAASNPVHAIDECPFLWKELERRGYATAFLDDGPTMGARAFNATFARQPTDYFIRPYILASEDHLPITHATFCTGPVSVMDRVLNHLTNIASTLKDRKHFSVAWLGHFKRSTMNLPRSVDDRTCEFFRELALYNVLNSTAVFFVSGGGAWEPQIPNPVLEWYEERMPVLFVSLPRWFEEAYPEKHRSLQENTAKLVSMFDLHLTLRDVLALPRRAGASAAAAACPKCSSLLERVDGQRTCDDAGIPGEFCTCTNFGETAADEPLVEQAARFVVQQIRKKIDVFIEGHVCEDLSLDRVTNSLVSDKRKYFPGMYKITFRTNPGGAVFQSTVYHNAANHSFVLAGPIERINAVVGPLSCMEDEALRPFCQCTTNSMQLKYI